VLKVDEVKVYHMW